MQRLRPLAVALSVLVVLAARNSARAEEAPALSLHGFGGWAAGYTRNDNRFGNLASKDVEVDNYYFSLNLLARPAESLTIHAQPTWQSDLRGQEATLDLVYLDWEVVRDLRLRAGKIKNPLGLYTEIYKVGTLRPFYLLPVFYRNVPEAFAGVGVNRLQRFGQWELEFDVIGGQMQFEPAVFDLPVGFDPQARRPVFGSVEMDWEGRDVFGGGLLVRPPVRGLEIGVASYSQKMYAAPRGKPLARLGDERSKVFVGSLEYAGDRFVWRSEGFVVRGGSDFESAYGEASYKLGEKWQVAAMADLVNQTDPPSIAEDIADHRSIGFGLNYWIDPKLVWKASYQRVSRNKFARPDDAVNLALAKKLEKETDVFIVGVHFSF